MLFRPLVAEGYEWVNCAGRSADSAEGKFQRIVDANRASGVDRATGAPTSIYTVITNKSGGLVTAFPGVP